MILGDAAIKQAFENGLWSVDNCNWQDLTIGPNSVDVTLNHKFLEPKKTSYLFNPDQDRQFYREVNTSFYNLERNSLILGSTVEAINCTAPLKIGDSYHTFAPMYEGRSTLARLGLFSHISAGFGDYGFANPFTLEFYYVGSYDAIMLTPGMRIGQIYFIEVFGVETEYNGAYCNSVSTDGAKLGEGRL